MGDKLNGYWRGYLGNQEDSFLGASEHLYDGSQPYSGEGYYCQICGQWVPYDGSIHYCYHPPSLTYHVADNKTERAFNVLKALVKERVIEEPGSFKKFCDLIEEISKII